MSEIYQNFAGVADLHAQLVAGQKAIEATLDRIEGQVAPLVAGWDSEAKNRYAATQARWNEAEAGLLQVLHDIGRVVSTGNDNMQEVERLNQQRFPG
ncbi:WXG100 family type VII secretion target [Rhodococcus sp. NPDC047139]|uniref:WXG100 family type VII secretion target n=1 Tax=Rhodococcus sp. NPDC047139 TaxID=3155141 RepID=UPI0033E64091